MLQMAVTIVHALKGLPVTVYSATRSALEDASMAFANIPPHPTGARASVILDGLVTTVQCVFLGTSRMFAGSTRSAIRMQMGQRSVIARQGM